MSSRRGKQKGFDNIPFGQHVTSLDNLPVSPVTQTQHIQIPTQYKQTFSTLKDFNKVKLVDLLQSTNSMMQMDKFVTLVSSDSGSIHLHDEAMEVLQRYVGNDVAFVGLWGSKGCDKSHFYEKVLALADVTEQEGKLPKYQYDSESSALMFYSRPFVKKDIKIFILDSTGYANEKLTAQQKMILDIMMALCQVVVLVDDFQEKSSIVQKQSSITEIGFRHFKQSLLRLYNNKKEIEDEEYECENLCWPQNLFMLYNSHKNIKKERKINNLHELQISKLFKSYNFSILHNSQGSQNISGISGSPEELYLKNTSTIFKQIYSKIHAKSYFGLKFRGNTCPHILSNLTHSLNTKQTLYLPKNFSQINKSVFQSIYNMHALSYVVKLKQYVRQNKPYHTDYLLAAFHEAYDETMDDYDVNCRQISTSKNITEKGYKNYQEIYDQKLEEYIRQKEKNIMSVNAKKSISSLYEREEKQKKQSNWKTQYKGLMSSYHEKLSQEDNKGEKQFDDNGKTYHIANKMKLIYQNMNAAEPPSSYNTKKEETKEMKILFKKREIELEEAIKKRTIQQKQYIETEKYQLNALKGQQRQIDKKINKLQALLVDEQKRFEKIIENQDKNEKQKKKVSAILYERQQLQKVYKTNITLKNQLQRQIQEPQIKLVNGKQNKEIEMLKTKLFEKQQEVSKQQKQYLKSKATILIRKKAEIRQVGQKRNIRRSSIR